MFEITKDSISIQTVIHKVKCRKEGSIITFAGTVREFTKEIKNVYLQYDELAIKKLSQIGEEVQEKWPETVVAITLRMGQLKISDIAVVIVILSPNHNQSFVVSCFTLDRIKKVLQIRKKEY